MVTNNPLTNTDLNHIYFKTRNNEKLKGNKASWCENMRKARLKEVHIKYG